MRPSVPLPARPRAGPTLPIPSGIATWRPLARSAALRRRVGLDVHAAHHPAARPSHVIAVRPDQVRAVYDLLHVPIRQRRVV